MIVLSLFDGLSGARIALDQMGVPVTYYSSEIDESALSISRYHYPGIIQLGDVHNITPNIVPLQVDLLIGGSPCQSLSAMAGQEASGLEEGESTLFWQYKRILEQYKPTYFILENVASMKPKDKERITKEIQSIV